MDWISLHIARNGGTAIKRTLEKVRGGEPFPEVHKEKTLAQVDETKKYFTFTRNPFDREVSLCAYALTYRPSRKERQGQILPVEVFEEWVFNGKHQWYMDQQVDYICPFINHIGFFGRFENLESDFLLFMRIHMPEIEVDGLEIVNDSHHLDWREYYRTSRVFSAVYERRKQDIHMLGYEDLCR